MFVTRRVLSQVSAEMRGQGADPVLDRAHYQSLVTAELKNKHGIQFRDETELNQATKFLHENGLLLHYEDATLRYAHWRYLFS